MSSGHAISDVFSDLPPILFYGSSGAASAADPINAKQTLFSGGSVSWVDGWMGARYLPLQTGPLNFFGSSLGMFTQSMVLFSSSEML